jgi:hypothetical protein
MKDFSNDNTNHRFNQNIKPAGVDGEGEQLISATYEPFVNADDIASLLREPRKNVVRLAGQGKITSYDFSGTKRHTYKFKRSEVMRDIEKLRRPSSTPPNDKPQPHKESSQKK